MKLPSSAPSASRGWKMMVLLVASTLVNLVRYCDSWLERALESLWPTLPAGEVAYLVFIATNLLVGMSLLALVLAVVLLERPPDVRAFFKLGRFDWVSFGLVALLTFGLNALERLFLRRLLFEPARLFLLSIGLWDRPSAGIGLQRDPHFVVLNVVLLVLVVWIEAPEEVFFRGYIQNHLGDRIRPTVALFASTALWALWHLFAPAEFVRVFAYGLVFGLAFRLRQNTTALAVWHPVSNRILMLAYLLGAGGLR